MKGFALDVGELVLVLDERLGLSSVFSLPTYHIVRYLRYADSTRKGRSLSIPLRSIARSISTPILAKNFVR
jgi:hypothetical protein